MAKIVDRLLLAVVAALLIAIYIEMRAVHRAIEWLQPSADATAVT